MDKEPKLTCKAVASNNYGSSTNSINDILSSVDIYEYDGNNEYNRVVNDCRFYYREDGFATTVIDKMIAIAINDLVLGVDRQNLSVTERSIFEAVLSDIIKFIRKAARSYLLSGLIVPEIKLEKVNKDFLLSKNIKRIDSLLYPTELWLRNSADIIIKTPLIGHEVSYFLKIPDEVVGFIQSGGEYSDGNVDKELYAKLLKRYPDFVAKIKKGETSILLENPLIVRGKTLEDSPYPMPYLYPALGYFKHKRNLRRMDYAMASRVISAILHVRMGNDKFPLTEDDEDSLAALESQLRYRNNIKQSDLERVFMLFTNHTVEMDWVVPDVNALLNTSKYDSVNQDIMLALGFPRILITGETERSFASDPEIATVSPIETLKVMRSDLIGIVEAVLQKMVESNPVLKSCPTIKFKPINLMSLKLFYEGLDNLYQTGNLSRMDYAEAFGFDLLEQIEKRSVEKDLFTKYNVDEVAPSNVPGANTDNNVKNDSKDKPDTKETE